MAKVRAIELGQEPNEVDRHENPYITYDLSGCKYLAKEVLVYVREDLAEADFGGMFSQINDFSVLNLSEPSEENNIPECLLQLITCIRNRPIQKLVLQNNNIGESGSFCFKNFCEKSRSL